MEPTRIDLDGTVVEVFADRERSNYIYLIFEGTTYCVWAKDPRNFDFLEETSLRVTDRGRARSKAKKNESSQPRTTGKSPKFQMGNEDQPPTREDLDAVLRHLPMLRQQAAARAADADAAEGLYPAQFSSAVRKVVDAFFQHRFMFPFNYQPWMDEAKKLQENRELLATADLETLRKLVVVHWRQDYWDYDHTHWESIAADGHLVALLDRLQEIAETMEPQTTTRESESTSDSEEGISVRLPGEEIDEARTATPFEFGEYLDAFAAIRERISEKQMVMLAAHYYSGGRAVTMRELATASGYDDYKAANLQYGSLAKKLLDAMGRDAPLYDDETPIAILALGNIVSRDEFGLEMHLVMHDSVARALERLELVEPISGTLLGESEEEVALPTENDPGIARTNKNQKWTHDLRVRLYSRLLSEFGPHSEWGTFAYPQGKRGRFEEVLRELADEFSRVSGKSFEWTALEQQMKWAITRQGRVKNAGFAYQYILNKSAALEAGFLTSSELMPFVHLEPADGVSGLLKVSEKKDSPVDGIGSAPGESGDDPTAGLASMDADSEAEWTGAMPLLDIAEIAAWLVPLENAVAQFQDDLGRDTSALDDLLRRLVQDIEDRGVFRYEDDEDPSTWLSVACVRATDRMEMLIDGMERFPTDNILALRRVLVYHKLHSHDPDGNLDVSYWRELALKGDLQGLVGAFDTIYRDVARKTIVSGWDG